MKLLLCSDLEKICPIALVFTPSDDEYPTKRLGRVSGIC